ncbi:hypothetical protein [Clostridium butyricum]|uniref:hypothetical protein n=1 Tax=Clostridium butyricum TaxID=1492 RepID=UPI00189C5ABD|nr:hypothetical protein [Clostridium butyricum]MDB2153809.1 hypothetical protein [Clostridium butyricum]
MKVYHEGERIYFNDESVSKLGYTNYNEDLWNNIKDLKFTVKYKTVKDDKKEAQYIYCPKLKKTLHQIVIDFYYGEEVRKEMYKNKFIIEHHDNDGFNCCIENLSFLSGDRNKSKAFGFDKDRERMMDKVSINIFKDFITMRYQVTLFFNKAFAFKMNDKWYGIASMHLLYEDSYRVVLNDCMNILDLIEETGQANINKLNCLKFQFEEYIKVNVTEEEKEAPIIIRDGIQYLNLNCPNQRVVSIPPKKDLYNFDLIDKQ